VTEEPTARQPTDGPSMWHCGSESESDDRQAMEDLMDHQWSDGPSLILSIRLNFEPHLVKGDGPSGLDFVLEGDTLHSIMPNHSI
ncbi:hypothetical protein HAX54_041028, partial [Datura stramonium]|nr:hypothetical protein [Datura stramonium]